MENINVLNKKNTLVEILLIYYLFNISTSSTLVSKQLLNYVENNRLIKHLIGFITVVVLLTLIHGTNISNAEILIYAFLCYTWFILSTKLDIHWNIIILLSLVVAYMYDNIVRNKNDEVDNDKVLTNEEKNKVKNIGNMNNVYILCGIIGITLLGVYLYSEKKHVQYGGGFDMMTFLLY